MERTVASYNISTAAKKLGISIRMIREYEKEGLIKPHRNAVSGYRVFSRRRPAVDLLYSGIDSSEGNKY